MSEIASNTKLSRLMYLGIFGGLFCSYLALGSVIPVLPIYVRSTFAADNLIIGLVVTGTALTAVITRPIAGGLADRHGYRSIMLLGALIVGIGSALYLMSLNLVALVLVRLFQGIGEASVFTAGAAWTVSLAPGNRRGQLIGLYGVSMWGGITFGTFIGAVLLGMGFTTVWLFATLMPAIGLLLIFSVPSPKPAATAAPQGLLLRPAMLPGLSLALAAAGYAGLAAFVVLHTAARGIENGAVALTAYGLTYAGTRLVIGHLPDQLGPRKTAAWSGAGEALGLLIVAFAPSLWVVIVGSLIMGTGFSLLYPSLALMVMNATEKEQQGAALGAYTSFWDLGLGIWGPVTGMIATAWGYPSVFIVAAACALAAVALAVSVRWGVAQPKPALQ